MSASASASIPSAAAAAGGCCNGDEVSSIRFVSVRTSWQTQQEGMKKVSTSRRPLWASSASNFFFEYFCLLPAAQVAKVMRGSIFISVHVLSRTQGIMKKIGKRIDVRRNNLATHLPLACEAERDSHLIRAGPEWVPSRAGAKLLLLLLACYK